MLALLFVPALVLAGSTGASAASSNYTVIGDGVWIEKIVHTHVYVAGVGYVLSEQVYPTWDARWEPLSPEPWNKAVAAHPGINKPGMKWQFWCHQDYAAGKTSWNLEPQRVATRNQFDYSCNPPFQNPLPAEHA